MLMDVTKRGKEALSFPIKFKAKIVNMTVSPSEKFFSLKLVTNRILICKIVKGQIYMVNRLKHYAMKDLVFVDSPDGEVVYFLTINSKLFMYDLDKTVKRIRLKKTVHRIFYFNSSNLLVYSNFQELGVFSLKQGKVINLVELKDNFQNEQQDKTLSDSEKIMKIYEGKFLTLTN